MDFELTEEQAMIRATVRDFAEKEIAPVARENDRNGHFPADIVKKMGEMGFMGLNLPSEYGGGELITWLTVLCLRNSLELIIQ